jgi:oligopeptide transport system ATP-binding protein
MAPLLEVRDLKTYFRTRRGVARAVDGVSFSLQSGETLGIVGESGSGKSVTALSLMGLVPKPAGFHPSGEILLGGEDLLQLPSSRMRALRGKDIAMVFQDPMTSLNPVMTVGHQIMESIRVHERVPGREARTRAIEMLTDVGIPSPERRVDDYPHQFSGGMRQRAMIAMALSCSPKVLIADEPTTALDVTIQAQILELMRSLQERYHTAIVLITHDMGVIAQLADRVLVMYAGRVVEQGRTDDVFYDPLMPYTSALLQSIPRTDVQHDELPAIAGSPPNLVSPPAGCRFRPRCGLAVAECAHVDPPLEERDPGHSAACVLDAETVRGRRQHVAATET